MRGHGQQGIAHTGGHASPPHHPVIAMTEVSGSETNPCDDRRGPLQPDVRADGRLHARHGRRLGRRQAVRAAGTGPDRTRGPVAAPPAHRPHRPEGRARDAARPRQPCHLRRPDGSGPQPERGPRLHATRPARGRRWARCSRASSPASCSPSSTLMFIAELGYDIAPLIASAGIIGVALGFGSQSAGQGLPVRHLHDLRGPVRRRRRGRPRRGRRHRRGRQPARHPAARRQRHRLVRPQRRDPPRRQHEPELGAHGAGHDASPTPRTSPACSACSPTSRTTSGRTRTSRAASSRSPPCGASRSSASTASSCACRSRPRPSSSGRVAREMRAADQGALRPRGHRDRRSPQRVVWIREQSALGRRSPTRREQARPAQTGRRPTGET